MGAEILAGVACASWDQWSVIRDKFAVTSHRRVEPRWRREIVAKRKWKRFVYLWRRLPPRRKGYRRETTGDRAGVDLIVMRRARADRGCAGTGKTMLAERSYLDRSRVQAPAVHPDLLPSDVPGSRCSTRRSASSSSSLADFLQYRARRRDQPGYPRTQSALLEAMGEGRSRQTGNVSLRSRSWPWAHRTPSSRGHVPLPEAQMDRFLMRLSLGYPGLAEEK